MFESTKKGLSELQSSLVKTQSYAERYQPRVSTRIENTPLERPNYIPMPKVKMQPQGDDFSGVFGAFREARKNPENFLPEDWNKATFGEKMGAGLAEAVHSGVGTGQKLLQGAVSDFGQGFVETQKLPGIAANKLGLISDEKANAWENMIQKERRGVKLTVDEFVANLVGQRVQYAPGEEPKTLGEKITAGIFGGIGAAISIGKLTKGIQSMAATPNLIKFVSQYPKMFSFLSTTAGSIVYGQADAQLMGEFQKRLHVLGRDTISGAVFGVAGNIKNVLAAIPGVGAISAGLAYLEGARGEDVLTAGIVGSVMEGTFRVGRFREPDTVLRNAAEKTMNEYGGNVTKDTTPRDMEMIYQKLVKDNPKAEDRVKLDRAYQFLSATKPTQTPDEANTMKDAITRVVSMVKGERQGNTFTGSPVDARQIARIKPEEVPTPADLYARILEMKLSPETTARVKEYINADKVNEMIATGKEKLDVNSFDKLKFQEHKQKIDDAMAEASFYLETAEAGKRIAIPSDEPGVNYTFMAQPSSFPDWVPSELRTRKLFDQVQESLYNGQPPTKGKAKELYDTVMNRVRERAGVDIENVREAEYVFNKLEDATGFQMKADELRKTIRERLGGKEPTDGDSVISYINAKGEKIITRLTKKELDILSDEIRTIPQPKNGESQIHLDADTPTLREVGKEVSREEFIAGHSQAKEVFETAKGEQTPFDRLVEMPRFKELLKTDKEFQDLVKEVERLNGDIDKTLNDISYAEAEQGRNPEGARGTSPDGITPSKKDTGRENSVQKSNAQDTEGLGKRKESDSVAPEGETRPTLKSQKEIAAAFGDLVTNPDHGRVRDKSVLLFEDVSSALAKGEIQPEGVARIIEADPRLSVEKFAEMYKSKISEAGRELNVLSQLQKRLKKSLLEQIDKKLEIARANNDLFATKELEKQRNQIERNIPEGELTSWEKIKLGYEAIDNVRRGLIVTQVATTARNIISQTASTAVTIFDDIQVATLEAVTGKRQPRDAYKRVMYDAMALGHQLTKSGRKNVEDYLKVNKFAEEKLYNQTSGEQGKMGKVVETLNTLNRAQEYFFRNSIFEARMKLLMDRKGITTLDKDSLTPKEWNDVVNDALELTYSKVPESGTFGADVLAMYRKMPFLTLLNPFPRFWVNSLKFLYEYNPTGFIKFVKPKEREALARGDYEAYRSVARAVTGTLMLSAALALRSTEAAGDKWYELKVKGKTIDLRAFAPFSSYLFIAEAMRYMAGAKTNLSGMDFLQGVVGINRIAGTGFTIIDILQSKDWEGFLNGTAKVLGSYVSGFTVPFRVFGDFVAGLSDEESILRYQKSSHPLNNLVNPTLNNLPFIRQMLPKYPDLTSDRFLENEHPWVRQLTGVNLMTKTWLAGEIDRMAIPYQSIYPNTGEKKLDLYIMEEMGKILEVQGPAIAKDPAYLAGSDFYKKNAILDLISETKQIAKMRAMRKHNDDFVQFERQKALDKQEEMAQ